MGGRDFKYNRLLDKLSGSELLFKIPTDFGADEYNVTFGMGTTGVIAAGTTVTVTVAAPRDLILRELLLDEQSLAFGAAGTQDARVTAITVEGNAALLGGGGASISAFSSRSLIRPKFDLPVQGGTSVAVSIANDTAATALEFVPTWLID
jgi:hypothetical protein